MLLGVDVGGTFTDAVLAFDGRVITAKAPTTPRDQSIGVMAAIETVFKRAGKRPGELSSFSHGMTVATNALLEGRGARAALIATEGFTDIVALGRQNRADLYRLCKARPAPLIPGELRYPAPERMTPEGPLRPLTDEGARELARRVARAEPESVAVTLLHSYRHPEHEITIGEALKQELPDVHVSLSHEVVGVFREFERAATTEVDAALSPLLGRYLQQLVERARDARIPDPTIMQSNGGLIDARTAARHAAWTVLSGPAGGAAGAAFVARTARAPDCLCFDMGGTSCDVCVVDGGSVQERSAGEVGDRPLALPMLAVHTVGAGGGSIAWRDPGGALRVGPRSAGANPGPACYGRGGNEPTVTDANLLLGYLSADAPLAGGVSLERGAAERAIATLAGKLDLELLACAQGIVRVANAEMIRALRVVTVERGIDPRPYALLAFGGAGPLHAAQIADELGIDTIVCPRASGVLAALGLVVSPRRRDVQRSVFLAGDALSGDAIARTVTELGEQARRALTGNDTEPELRNANPELHNTEPELRDANPELHDTEPELRATYELRYRGQAFELAIQAGTAPEPSELRTAFEAEHDDRYGYSDPEQELELVTIRVSALIAGVDVELSGSGQESDVPPSRTNRMAIFGNQELEFEVLAGAPLPGTPIDGPAIVELAESTLVVPPDWSGEVDVAGTIRLTRAR